MVRVKKGKTALKRRRNVLSKVKGYRWGRSKKEKQAREAMYHAGNHAFQHRRKKKGEFRALFNIRINAALKDMSYSRFMNRLKIKNVKLNRKVLAELAKDEKDVFDAVVEEVK